MKNKLKYLLSILCCFFQPEYFCFNGNKLKYLSSMYNISCANERSIEVPIIEYYIRKYGYNKTGNFLEVGNVLYHYGHVYHEVIDRDELGTDLYTYKFTKKYDLIVSISTIEHMDDPRKALEIIKSLLNPGGKAVITIPLGYNIDADLLDFNEQY